jgi:hypothetical protein
MFWCMDGTLDELRSSLAVYQSRYRDLRLPPELERLEMAIGRRRSRISALEADVTRLRREIERMENEIEGCRKGYEALIMDTIERARQRHNEGWTPLPVVGYRLWAWRDGGLQGAWEAWSTRTKAASCRRGNDDVPHSDGRCGRLGCGIYATKDLSALLTEHTDPHSHGYLAGLVQMTGKVVEHDKGYRAGRVTVIAGVLVGHDGILAADDAAVLDEIFAGPDAAMMRWGRKHTQTAWDEIHSFLGHDRSIEWTSETKSA